MLTAEELLAQIRNDEAAKQRFFANPAAYLRQFGIEVPPEINVQMHEDTPALTHVVLPESAEAGDAPADPVERLKWMALTDAGFRAQLEADPAAAFGQVGIEVPAGVAIRVLQNSGNTLHFVLPAVADELQPQELESIAGGFYTATAQSLYTVWPPLSLSTAISLTPKLGISPLMQLLNLVPKPPHWQFKPGQ